MGLPEEEVSMPSMFGFWILDAFQSQYELGLGEFQLDGYR